MEVGEVGGHLRLVKADEPLHQEGRHAVAKGKEGEAFCLKANYSSRLYCKVARWACSNQFRRSNRLDLRRVERSNRLTIGMK